MSYDSKLPLPKSLSDLIAVHAALSPVGARIPTVQHISTLSRSKIFELLALGQLHAVKLGRHTLITWESLCAYLANLPSGKFGGQG